MDTGFGSSAGHTARVSNGPTEAINNLIKRVKRVAFGMRNFDHYRIRLLLYAGHPNWDLLDTITPRRNPKRPINWVAPYCGTPISARPFQVLIGSQPVCSFNRCWTLGVASFPLLAARRPPARSLLAISAAA